MARHRSRDRTRIKARRFLPVPRRPVVTESVARAECDGMTLLPPLVLDLGDVGATRALAARVAALLRPGDAILLAGPLGAGKTEFARALLRHLTGDAALEVPSPSYTLVQSYASPIGPVHHFDLWRIEGPGALTELGWEEARKGIVLVEWPDRLGRAIAPDALVVELQPTGPDSREAVLSGWPDRLGRLA
jgi:tRNA threonylcarbamoyladenosine biosynthesis protein TsaE